MLAAPVPFHLAPKRITVVIDDPYGLMADEIGTGTIRRWRPSDLRAIQTPWIRGVFLPSPRLRPVRPTRGRAPRGRRSASSSTLRGSPGRRSADDDPHDHRLTGRRRA
jgi:hypothetical protein